MTTDQAIKILNGAIKKPNTIDGYLGQALTMAINALKNQPVRCKDCKYWCDASCPAVFFDGNFVFHSFMEDDDWCSRGELRGEADDSN